MLSDRERAQAKATACGAVMLAQLLTALVMLATFMTGQWAIAGVGVIAVFGLLYAIIQKQLFAEGPPEYRPPFGPF